VDHYRVTDAKGRVILRTLLERLAATTEPADKGRAIGRTVMRWNEGTLRRLEALIVGIVIAIVVVAYVVSKLR
jgi:hypothetical protein